MKIAVYSHSIPPAVDGVSKRMASLLQQLCKDGHEVLLFTLESDPLLENLFPSSTPIRHITLASTFLAIYPTKRVAVPTLGNQLVIFNALQRERPDVLHCTLDGISPLFILAAKILNVPAVGSVHTDVQQLLTEMGVWSIVGAATSFKEGVESRLLHSCATTSPSFKAKLGQGGVLCDHVLKTGVKVSLFRPEARSKEVRDRLTFGNPDGLLVVYVGRFGPEKRLDKLVSMCDRVDNVYLALMGDGAMGPWLSERHGSWTNQGQGRTKGGIYCRTGFLGHEDLAPVYASADVHVSCSHFETLGNTVLEAHACGTSVIVPKAQGFIDTVTHERDGFLFDGTRLSDGAACLARLRDDRSMCRAMGERGRAKVSMQSPERVSRDTVAWYQRACIKAKEDSVTMTLERAISITKGTLLVMLVVSFWFTTDMVHAFIRASWVCYARLICVAKSLIRYCQHTRNALGNSSFFNKISNTYKALSNIPLERER